MGRLEGKNNYSKKKIIKGFLGVFAVIGISLLFFHGNCFAADETTYNILNISQMLSTISQFVYVLIWPVLVVAGAALDNSLIYGSFLNLDVALWNLWNIMKNFANFALGFLFIFSIGKTLFNSIGIGQKGGGDNPMTAAKTTVTNTLLAGIFIQMSWFIVAMLIDLSTVLIYSVGGLPISMLSDFGGQDQEIQSLSSRPILKLNTKITENGEGSIGVNSYYSYGQYNFSPCYIPKSIAGNTSEYIVGRKYINVSDAGGEEFYPGHCTVGGVVYTFAENTGFFESDYCSNNACSTNSGYYNKLQLYITSLSGNQVAPLKESCVFISLRGDEHTASGGNCTGYGMLSFTGGIYEPGILTGFKLSTLLENAKSYIGPFVTMYSSVLEYGEFMNGVGSTSTVGGLFSLILNTFFVLVLFIPVAILMVLLIIRVGLLWIVIAISPIIVLVKFFGNENGPLKELANNDIFKKFSFENIAKQIFAPVLVVFAISMSIVFLTAVGSTKPTEEDASQEANTPLLSAFGITPENCTDQEKNKCDYNILGLVSIKIDAQANNYHKDIFVRALMMLLSTGIVRFFLKFAIEFMSETGKKLMKSSSDLVKNIPIVPLPSGGAVGLDVLKNNIGLSNRIDAIVHKMDAEQKGYLNTAFPWLNGVNPVEDKTGTSGSPSTTGPAGVTSAQITQVINEINNEGKKTYGDLSPESQAILTSLYGSATANNFATFETQYIKQIDETGRAVAAKQSKTNADAFNLTSAQLDFAVKTNNEWKTWAASMVGGAVHTSEGVRIVSVVKGSERNNPVYEILTREEYENKWFGPTPENVNKETFENRRNTDEEKYTMVNRSLDALSKQYEDLLNKGDGSRLSDDKREQFEEMQAFFDENTLRILRQLDPDRFKSKKEGDEGEE